MTAYYNEWDPYAAEWLKNLIAAGLIAPGDVDTRSIAEVQPDDLIGYTQVHFFAGIGGWSRALRLAGWPDDRPVWTGSCPCQPFSAAGKRKGVEDERHLWPEFRRLIAECDPAVVFGEQVASKDGRLWLAGVRADLETLGYAVGAADLCAAGVGAPHIRQRLWWVADSHGGLAGHGHLQPGGQHGQQPQDGGAVERVADTERDTGGPGGSCQQPGGRVEAPPAGPHAEPGRRGDAGRLGHADDAGSQGRGGNLGEERAGERAAGPAGASERVEHAPGDGREQRGAEPGGRGAAGGCSDGFWSHAEWLACADGKSRRTEPGIFPLAHGVSFKLGSGSALEGKSRVAMLRAAGNAIVPQVAAQFIEAFMRCRP